LPETQETGNQSRTTRLIGRDETVRVFLAQRRKALPRCRRSSLRLCVFARELFQVNMEKIRILIVDDEPSVGDALKLVLESNGYEVVLVTKGLDGIDQARTKPFGFSVVDLYL